MNVELTESQQQALDAEGSPRLIDPRTKHAYVLVPAEDYETVREVLEEERWRGSLQKTALRNAVGRMNET